MLRKETAFPRCRAIIIIIIIIINDIYIAQIRKIKQMRYQQLNRKVFNCFLNTSREMSGIIDIIDIQLTS